MLYVKDPLSLKESMFILLETLPSNQYPQLKEFIRAIPSTVGRTSLKTSKELEESLKRCIEDFKATKSYFWLREDFKNALYDIEIQINKKVS